MPSGMAASDDWMIRDDSGNRGARAFLPTEYGDQLEISRKCVAMAYHACPRAHPAGGLARIFHGIFAAAPSCQVEHVARHRRLEHEYYEHCMPHQVVARA